MSSSAVYAFAVQYGVGDMRFDMKVADAEKARFVVDQTYANSDMNFEEFRLDLWDSLATAFETGQHLKTGRDTQALGMGIAWLALTSDMHEQRPEWDGFCLKIGPKPGTVGVQLEASNPYAEYHEGREQLFAVGKGPRQFIEDDMTMFRAWAAKMRAEIEKARKTAGRK